MEAPLFKLHIEADNRSFKTPQENFLNEFSFLFFWIDAKGMKNMEVRVISKVEMK